MSSLPTPPSRRLLHTRVLAMHCFERSDGAVEVEGHLTDTKPFDLHFSDRSIRPAGVPIHDVLLRLTIDRNLEIIAAEAAMPVGAHASCIGATPSYRALVGLRIGEGWVREARRRIGVAAGCTHLSEMLHQLGTTALQGIYGMRQRQKPAEEKIGPIGAKQLDSCFGLRAGGEIDRLRVRPASR